MNTSVRNTTSKRGCGWAALVTHGRRGCGALLFLAVVPFFGVSAAHAAGVSLQFPRFLTVGKGAFSKYLYVGSARGLVVYERSSVDGKLSFVQSLTEKWSGVAPNPSYDRCDGGAIANFSAIRGIVTTDSGQIYAKGTKSSGTNTAMINTLHHDGLGVVVQGSLEVGSSYYLHVGGSTLFSTFAENVKAYQLGSATPRPSPTPVASFGPTADMVGAEHSAFASAAGLLFVPGHGANKITVLQTPSLTHFQTLTEADHGIKGPYWVAVYPPDTADFVYVAGSNSADAVIALKRSGATFTRIGDPGDAINFQESISLAISSDGKNVYVGSSATGKIKTLLRTTSGADEGKLEASSFDDETGVPLFALAMDPDGKNLYGAVPDHEEAAAPHSFVVSFSRDTTTGQLSNKTIIDNDAEPAYVLCTTTPTLSPTSTPTQTPTITPTSTPTPYDTKVDARPRLDWKNYPVDGPDTADKDKKVAVTNVDPIPAARTISFPMPTSDCPTGLVLGVDPGSLNLNAGKKKKVELKLSTVPPASTTFFEKATKKIPARCHIVFKAQNAIPGDRTFWNNTTTVEVDFLTASLATPPEFVLEGVNNPATIQSTRNDVKVRFRIFNHDTVAHSYKITSSFASQVSDDPPAPPLPPCALPVPAPVIISNLAGGGHETGIVTVVRQPPPKTAGRCTLILSAGFEGAPGTDTEPTNNSTHVVIDIEK